MEKRSRNSHPECTVDTDSIHPGPLDASQNLVSNRLLVPLLTFLCLLLLYFVGILYWQHNQFRHENANEKIQEIQIRFQEILDDQSWGLAATVENLVQTEKTQDALARQDTGLLLSLHQDLFKSLHNQFGVTHFYFHSPERVNLVRIHKPEKSGDLINRFTALEAEQTGQTASGIELGPLGTFTLRVVKPVFRQEKLIGYIELGKEIEEVLQDIHKEQNVELAILIEKEYLNRETWQRGMEFLKRDYFWEEYSSKALIYSSSQSSWMKLTKEFSSIKIPEGVGHQNVRFEKKKWQLMSCPLVDAGNRTVGQLLLGMDITEYEQAFTTFLFDIGGLTLLIVAALITFFYLNLRKTDEFIYSREQSIHDAQNQYRILFESSRDALVILSPKNYKFVRANKAAYELYKIDSEEKIKEKTPVDLSPEYQPDGTNSVALAEKKIKECFLAGSCCFEWTHRDTEGREFPAMVLLNRIEYKGELLIQGSVRDITQQKQAETDLKTALRQQQAIFDSSLVGIMVLENRILVNVNHRMAEMLGYTPDEMIGKGPQQLHLSTENFEEFGQKYYWQLAEKEIVQAEYPLRHKDGHTVWCLFNGKAISPPDMAKGAVWVIDDITERKAHEIELQRTKEQLELFLKTAATAVYTVSPDKIITTANRQFCEILGYAQEEIIGKNCRILAEKNCDQCPLNCPGAEDEAYYLQDTVYDKYQNAHDILKNTNAVRDEQGKLIYLIHSFIDVSELVEARQKAEMANQTKSEFLANMSHEIRTPMNAIIGFSDILAEEEMPGHQKEFIHTIRNAGHTLLALINDILDFSKIESGKLNVEKVQCGFSEFLANIESMMRPSAIKKGLKFEICQCSQLPAQIETDPTRLTQCLINLISNAVKFTDRGHVFVNVSLEDKDGEPLVRFDVEDTGIGIPQHKKELIFDAFSQADATTTRKYGGTGLGLTITKNLVELLGGSLSVSSETGKGSVFTLTLPVGYVENTQYMDKYEHVEEVFEQPAEQTQEEKTPMEGLVLVADDAPSNQMLIKLLLEKMGLNVVIVEDGLKALEACQKQTFSLIFMDMQMPNMNGYQATAKIREIGIETPVIALTANAMKGDREKCIQIGCTDYLPKPLHRKELTKLVKQYLCHLPA